MNPRIFTSALIITSAVVTFAAYIFDAKEAGEKLALWTTSLALTINLVQLCHDTEKLVRNPENEPPRIRL